MNFNVTPEMLAQIEADLKKESEQDKGLIESALESATTIRENLIAIKGEEYARLVEIGVLTHKRIKLCSFLISILEEAVEDFGPVQRMAFATIDTTMSARIINHACKLIAPDADAKYAAELTSWIDRIVDAETDGIAGIEEKLFGKEDE